MTGPAGKATMLRATTVGAIEPGVPLAVTLEDGRHVCLARDGAEVFAVEDRCSHRDFALSSGDLVAPCVLECPWHGAQFDVRTGRVLQGPATDPLVTFEVLVVDGSVFVGPVRNA